MNHIMTSNLSNNVSKEKHIFILEGQQSLHLCNDMRFVNLNFPINPPTILLLTFCMLFVLGVNIGVLSWLKMKERVFVDSMICLDCITNLLCIVIIFLAFPVRVYGNKLFCGAITFFRIYIMSIKRSGICRSSLFNCAF